MKALMLGAILAVVLSGLCLAQTRAEDSVSAPKPGEVTFQMNQIASLRDFYTRYFGKVPPYRERGEEDLQDSIARCIFAYGKAKAKRWETVILYVGRDPSEATNLICSVFPMDEGAYRRLCRGIGMAFVAVDEEKFALTCGPEARSPESEDEDVGTGDTQ